MSELLWHGWVNGYRWQTRLLEGLGVMGKKRYKEGSKVIEYCIVDDAGLARLMHYWPCPDEWHSDDSWPEPRRIENTFTLSDHNNNQVWGEEREARLRAIREVAANIRDTWPHYAWPHGVVRHVQAYSDVNDFTMRRVA